MSTAVVRRNRDQRIQVYNPTLYGDHVEIGGICYHFEPRGFARCVCAAHKGDNLGVHAAYDWPRDNRGRLQTGGVRKVAAGGELTADAVAEMIVSPDCRGGKFFCIVEGSSLEREETMRQAEVSWAKTHIEEVEQRIMEWERACALLQESNPGKLPPKKPESIKEFYRFRKLWNSNQIERSAFVCMACGEDCMDVADLHKHVIEEHPGIAADRGITPGTLEPRLARPTRGLPSLADRVAKTKAATVEEPEPETPEPEPEPGEGPGTEVAPPEPADQPDPEDDTETGDAVQRRAQRAGVTLSMADIRALGSDDQEAIADVKKRIQDVRAGRARLLAEQKARRAAAANAHQ